MVRIAEGPPAPLPAPAPDAPAIDGGVIEEARRRQRRRRGRVLAAATTALLTALLAPLLYGGGGGVSPRPHLRPASSLTPLTGTRLSASTHLTLAVSDNGGGVFLLDLDRGSARAVTGLGVQPRGGPQVSLRQYGPDALATVTRWNCAPFASCMTTSAASP